MIGHVVVSEQGVQEGTKHTPLRKFRIQLQREVFSPRFPRLVMSLKGTMVLNAEL